MIQRLLLLALVFTVTLQAQVFTPLNPSSFAPASSQHQDPTWGTETRTVTLTNIRTSSFSGRIDRYLNFTLSQTGYTSFIIYVNDVRVYGNVNETFAQMTPTGGGGNMTAGLGNLTAPSQIRLRIIHWHRNGTKLKDVEQTYLVEWDCNPQTVTSVPDPSIPVEMAVTDTFTIVPAGSNTGWEFGYPSSMDIQPGPSGTYLITASEGGMFTVTVKAPAGSGWCSAQVVYAIKVIAPDEPQYASVSLPSDIEAGESISGQATGAKEGNAYNISVVSGDVNAAINSATGQITIMGGQTKGPWEVQVWISAGNGYSRSDYASAGGLVIDAKKHKATVTFDNRDSALATEFRVYQDGVVIATRIIPAGAVVVQTFEVPTASQVIVKSVGKGLQTDGTIWMPTGDGEETEFEVGAVDPEKVSEGVNPPSKSTVKPGSPDPTKQPDSTKNVWQSVTAENKDKGVTAKTVAEGIDKVTAAVKALGKAGAGSSGAEINTGEGSALQLGVLEGLMPEVPEIILPDPVRAISFQLHVPKVIGVYEIKFDTQPYETELRILRNIFLAVMGFGYFILYVSTIRKAFAN